MMASILKIIITRNTICDNLVGFPKSGHIYDFIINTVTVCKVYAGDNTAIPQLFNYLTCTIPSK